MTRNLTIAFVASLLMLCLESSTSFSQINPNTPEKIWFIARVVDTDPFTLEFVDDWYHYQRSQSHGRYVSGVGVNPQSITESVKDFRLGDMISGEVCTMYLFNCPPNAAPVRPVTTSDDGDGRPVPPSLAINLSKLGREYVTRYARVGTLISYKPHRDNIVRSMTISRDGKIVLDSYYGGSIERKLSDAELRKLEGAFFKNRIDQLMSSVSDDYFKLELATIFGKYRTLKIDYSTNDSKVFTDMLDGLIETHVRNANYRITYRWRITIKDWQHGDVFELDQAAVQGYEYIRRHWDRLSKTRAPKKFYEEAKETYGVINKFYYRYKGRLYQFSFPTCTDRANGTWSCSSTFEVGKRDGSGKLISGYDEWPNHVRTKLRNIPRDGLTGDHVLFGKGMAIKRDELERNRAFYWQFIKDRGWFREGDHIYIGVQVWFG